MLPVSRVPVKHNGDRSDVRDLPLRRLARLPSFCDRPACNIWLQHHQAAQHTAIRASRPIWCALPYLKRHSKTTDGVYGLRASLLSSGALSTSQVSGIRRVDPKARQQHWEHLRAVTRALTNCIDCIIILIACAPMSVRSTSSTGRQTVLDSGKHNRLIGPRADRLRTQESDILLQHFIAPYVHCCHAFVSVAIRFSGWACLLWTSFQERTC